MPLSTQAGRALTGVSLTAAVLVSAMLTVAAGHASAAESYPRSVAAAAGPEVVSS